MPPNPAMVLDEPSEVAVDEDSSVPVAPPRGRTLLKRAVLALAIVALLGGAVQQERSLRDHRRHEADRADAVQAARAEVLTLTSVTSDGADDQIDRLLHGATASFRDNLSQFAASLKQALSQGDVSSVGSVVDAGVVSDHAGEVVVLVAATATVKNTSVPSGEPRNYRLKVTMQKIHGRWLVSDLAFVP